MCCPPGRHLAASLLLPALLITGCGGTRTASRAGDVWREPVPQVGAAALDDRAYVEFLKEGLQIVAEGDPWGTRLHAFCVERGKLARLDYLFQRKIDPGDPRTDFWLTLYEPGEGNVAQYAYHTDINALMVPKIPIDQHFAGMLLAHELQHAYDDLMQSPTNLLGPAGHIMTEVRAYTMESTLADRITEGRFSATLDLVFESGGYDQPLEGLPLFRPDRTSQALLDTVLGIPTPWEMDNRDSFYMVALSLSRAEDNIQRRHVAAMLVGTPLRALVATGPMNLQLQHQGFDLETHRNEEVTSPIGGVVNRIERSASPRSEWAGLIIEGTGEHAGVHLRILGIAPRLAAGDPVAKGEVMGVAQDPSIEFPFVRRHIHVELYLDGERDLSYQRLTQYWQGRTPIHPVPRRPGHYRSGSQNQFPDFPGEALLAEGARLEVAADYAAALERFRQAFEEPDWEVTNTPILHVIARDLAAMGRFGEAAQVQAQLVDLLQAEIDYGSGLLPHPRLGTVGYTPQPRAVSIMLDHHRQNLQAYLDGRDTVYVY